MLTAALLSFLAAFNAPPSSASPANAAPAGGPVLTTGAPAPDLTVDNWVKGDAVKAFEPDKVYVVEFWATWCGPCLVTIPHLTKLQEENPDNLVIIGVAASERPDLPKDAGDKPENIDMKAVTEKMLAKVKTFVDQQGDKMKYRVAFDGDGSMSRDWMRAFRQHTIPCAFIVKDNKVAWVGNPKDMETALARALGKEPPKKKKPHDKADGLKDGSATSPTPPAKKQAAD